MPSSNLSPQTLHPLLKLSTAGWVEKGVTRLGFWVEQRVAGLNVQVGLVRGLGDKNFGCSRHGDSWRLSEKGTICPTHALLLINIWTTESLLQRLSINFLEDGEVPGEGTGSRREEVPGAGCCQVQRLPNTCLFILIHVTFFPSPFFVCALVI